MTGRTKAGKRRSNPLERSVGRVSRPVMKFDGQTIHASTFQTQAATDASKQGSDWLSIDCSNGEGINRAATEVIRHYQNYKYTQASIEWIPAIGPAATESGARVMLAYIDNPELIVTFKAASNAAKATLVTGMGNVKTFNAWERFTYKVPLTYRRKFWNINPTISSPGNEETERSIQGIVAVIYQSINASVAAFALGQFRMVSNTWVSGFSAVTLT